MRSKLKSHVATTGHVNDPRQAKELIPELEICWGSRAERRPIGHQHSDPCGCPTRTINYISPGHLEPSTVAERDINQYHPPAFQLPPFFPFSMRGQKKSKGYTCHVCIRDVQILPREVAHLGVLLDRMVRCREVETLGKVGSPSSAGSKNDHGPRESLVTPEAGLSSPVQPSKNGFSHPLYCYGAASNDGQKDGCTVIRKVAKYTQRIGGGSLRRPGSMLGVCR